MKEKSVLFSPWLLQSPARDLEFKGSGHAPKKGPLY